MFASMLPNTVMLGHPLLDALLLSFTALTITANENLCNAT